MKQQFRIIKGREYEKTCNYIFKERMQLQKTVLNIETIGAVFADKTFLGFEYKAEKVLTSFDDNIEILKYLEKNDIERYRAIKNKLGLRG